MDEKKLFVSLQAIPALTLAEVGTPILTDAGPKLITSPDGPPLFLSPGTSYHGSGWLGYWGWFIAGELISSAFHVPMNATPDEAVERAKAARLELVAFLRDLIRSARERQGPAPERVGIVRDGESFPTPQN